MEAPPAQVQRVPDLPTELTDAIIDYLRDDKPTLSHCCLVCSSWLHSGRYNLFYSVRVRGEHPTRGFAAFLAFIEATPHISGYIQELTFRVTGALSSRTPETRRIGPYILATALQQLPSLRTLGFDNVSWDRTLLTGEGGRTLQSWPMAPKRELDTITYSRVVTEETLSSRQFRLNDALEIYTNFSRLRVINILQMTLSLDLAAPVVPRFPEQLQLEEMNLHTNYARLPDAPVLDRIHETMARTLRRLSIACRNDEEAPFVGSLLRVIGPTLQELRLDHSDMTALRAFSTSPHATAKPRTSY